MVLSHNPYNRINFALITTEYGTVVISYLCPICRYNSAYGDGKTWNLSEPIETLALLNEQHLSEIHNLTRRMYEVL